MGDKKSIVVVDDNNTNIKIIVAALSSDYKVIPFTNGKEAINFFRKGNVCSLILLDIEMPELDGFETLRLIKECENAHNIPIVFLTGKHDIESEIHGLELGAVDYILKPINPALVKTRIFNQIQLDEYSHRLQYLVDQKTKTIEKLSEVTIITLVNIVGSRDSETGGHINRTSEYVTVLGEGLRKRGIYPDEITEHYIELMRRSSPLHDIGKVGISDAILNKPGKLTEEEYEEMKRHAAIGGEALRDARIMMNQESFLDMAEHMTMSHHERWDGSGYPLGLFGIDIPVCARIMAVGDVYDALISKRPYKAAMSFEQAEEIIISGSGKHFDPNIIDVFKEIKSEFKNIAIKFNE